MRASAHQHLTNRLDVEGEPGAGLRRCEVPWWPRGPGRGCSDAGAWRVTGGLARGAKALAWCTTRSQCPGGGRPSGQDSG